MLYNQKTTPVLHTETRENQLKWCKTSNILLLMSNREIARMYATSLDFNKVGVVTICLRPFDVVVVQVLLYGMKVWDCSISLNAFNEIDKFQNLFLLSNWKLNP